MDKREIIIATSLIVIIVLFIFFVPDLTVSGNVVKGSSNSGVSKPVIITKDNFPLYIKQQPIIKDLPKKAVISLRLYSYNAGQRKWEESYTITKANAKLGVAKEPDLEIIVHSLYIPYFGNLCNAIKNANNNGHLEYIININKASLLWKYRGMMKYKDCL